MKAVVLFFSSSQFNVNSIQFNNKIQLWTNSIQHKAEDDGFIIQLNSLQVLFSSGVSSVILMILLNIKCMNIIWSYLIKYGDVFEAILMVQCFFVFFGFFALLYF